MSGSGFFVTGGPLRSDDPSYIERSADRELRELVAQGEYCYVLTPRQMGKSSLMARTARRLRAEGTRVAAVDLTGIGGESKQVEEAWYYGLLYRLHKELGPSTPLKPWWEERAGLPAPQRFVEFFREVVLGENEPAGDKVVVFLDEIDATIRFPFSSSFFAAVRSCFGARALEPGFERLSFVLLGVASPDQLISDAQRTPFNIGQRIELEPFDLDEATALAQGLGDAVPGTLERVLHWSGGQPYLTQSLCTLVTEAGASRRTETGPSGPDPKPGDSDPSIWVDTLVEQNFLTASALREEAHLSNIQRRLLDQPGARARLLLFRKILRGEKVLDSPTSWVMSALKLSGVVRTDSAGALQLSNRIYGRVFDRSWIASNLPTDWLRRDAINSVAFAFLALVAWLAWYAWIEPRSWIEQLSIADEDYAVAELAHQALSANWLFPQAQADEFLAQFWERRAQAASIREGREEALLYWLRALEASDTDLRRRQAAHLSGGDWNRLRRTLWHESGVLAVAFSPDGKTILTGSYDGTARLWRSDSGAPIGGPMQHEGSVPSVAFGPDGKTVLTGSNDGTARLWRAGSGDPIGQPLKTGDLAMAVFSSDGKKILTSGSERTVQLWWLDPSFRLGGPVGFGEKVESAAFSPDGETILTGSSDGSAQLWRTATGTPVGEAVHHGESVVAVDFSPDNQTAFTGSVDGLGRIWQADLEGPGGILIKHTGQTLRTIDLVSVAFAPHGQSLLTASLDSTARLWDVATGTPIGEPLQHGDDVVDVDFSPDGKVVLTGSLDGTAVLWNAETSEPIGEPIQHNDWVFSVAFGPEGKKLFTGDADGTARIWQADLGAPIDTPISHETWTRAVAFSPDGEKILTSDAEGTVRLWLADSGTPLGQPMHHESMVDAVAFSPDGMMVLTSSGSTWRFWEADTGIPFGEPIVHGLQVESLAFSPDGRMVATSGADGAIRLWKSDSGASLGKPMGYETEFFVFIAVAFSPDGELLVTGNSDGTVQFWQTDTQTPLGEPLQHDIGTSILDRGALAVAFGPGGKTLLTGSLDGTVQLWQVGSRAPIGEPMRYASGVLEVAFSPDGVAWIRTRDWIHVADVSMEGLEPKQSRFGSVAAWHFPMGCSPCNEVDLVLGPIGQAFGVQTFRLGFPDEDPLEGSPSELLDDWLGRLALRFDSRQRLELRWPIPQARRTGDPQEGSPRVR